MITESQNKHVQSLDVFTLAEVGVLPLDHHSHPEEGPSVEAIGQVNPLCIEESINTCWPIKQVLEEFIN